MNNCCSTDWTGLRYKEDQDYNKRRPCKLHFMRDKEFYVGNGLTIFQFWLLLGVLVALVELMPEL